MKVSVCIITYNQEAFIAQTLESVLNQKTSFDYELVIGEDCSTDNTRNIIQKYQERYPQKIRLIERNQNIGMMRNFTSSILSCKGEYIALLEGDDFWVDEYKLEKQVSFMEDNPTFSGCFTNNYLLDMHSGLTRKETPSSKETLITSDLIEKNHISTLTFLFKNHLIQQFPGWFSQLSLGDWPLYILLSLNGPIKKLDFYSATYRIHPASQWSSKKHVDKIKRIAFLFENIKENLPLHYSPQIENKLKSFYYYIIIKTIKEGNDRELSIYYKKYIQLKSARNWLQILKLKVKILLHSPSYYLYYYK
jgi:glycosyltransferase involved in cell wall biosynthesis